MTPIVHQQTELDTLFPEGKTVTIPRRGGESETIEIFPMPLKKWRQGLVYVSQIASTLGFQLAEEPQQVAEDILDLADANSASTVPELKGIEGRIFKALMDEGNNELMLTFVAFATDKDRDFFDGLYDEIIDIIIALIEVNLVFFFLRLLPKFLKGATQITALAKDVQALVKQHQGK